LRDEIGRLRERLAEKSNNMIDMPDNDDVMRMEVSTFVIIFDFGTILKGDFRILP